MGVTKGIQKTNVLLKNYLKTYLQNNLQSCMTETLFIYTEIAHVNLRDSTRKSFNQIEANQWHRSSWRRDKITAI